MMNDTDATGGISMEANEISLKMVFEKFSYLLFLWEMSFRDVAVFIQLIKEITKAPRSKVNISDLVYTYVLNSLMLQPHFLLMTVWIFCVFEQYINNNSADYAIAGENSNDLFSKCSSCLKKLRDELDSNVAIIITSFIFIKISDFLYAMTSIKMLRESEMSSEHLKKVIINKTGKVYVEDPESFAYTLSYLNRYIGNFQTSVAPSLFADSHNDFDYMTLSVQQVNMWSRIILNKLSVNDVFISNCEKYTDVNSVIFGALYYVMTSLDDKNELANILNSEVSLSEGARQPVKRRANGPTKDEKECNSGVMCPNPSVNNIYNDIGQYSGLFCKLNCLDLDNMHV